MKRLFIAFLLLLLFAPAAKAHGLAKYISTPVTPPLEFTWWFIPSVAILLFGCYLVIWKLLGRSRGASIALSLGAVVAFTISFLVVGVFASGFHTGPPPGLGIPCSTMWGLGWEDVGGLFVFWNLLGMACLYVSLLVWGGLRRSASKRLPIALAVLGMYAAGLIPYISTTALAHGWAGGYVQRRCSDNVQKLNEAVYEYAKGHGDYLPEADNLESLLKTLQPHAFGREALHCSVAMAFERSPEPYVWNAAFSGLSLDDANKLAYSNESPIICPYHGDWGYWTRRQFMDFDME